MNPVVLQNQIELEQRMQRLQRMLDGIEGVGLLLSDHLTALENGTASPLVDGKAKTAMQALLYMAVNGRRCVEALQDMCSVQTRH